MEENKEEGVDLFNLYNFEPSVHLPTSTFCQIVKNFKTGCYENSILEFWHYNDEELKEITKDDIIFTLNHTTTR